MSETTGKEKEKGEWTGRPNSSSFSSRKLHPLLLFEFDKEQGGVDNDSSITIRGGGGGGWPLLFLLQKDSSK